MTLLRTILGFHPIKPREDISLALESIPNGAFQIIDASCGVGIEVEVERGNEWRERYYRGVWNTHADNSLRNSGIEFVSKILFGSQIPKALDHLFDELFSPTSEFTPRTSIHLHLDMLDCSTEQIAQTVAAYLIFERMLYNWVGNGREHNIFCVPLLDTHTLKGLITSLTMDDSYTSREYTSDELRYSGLNLAALRKFGSLEFRHLYGTDDTGLIMTWLNALLSIRRWALQFKSLKQFLERVLALNTNSQYLHTCWEVFGEMPQGFIQDFIKGGYRDQMAEGVNAVKYGLVQNNKSMAKSTESKAYKWMLAHKQVRDLNIHYEDLAVRLQHRVNIGGAWLNAPRVQNVNADPQLVEYVAVGQAIGRV